MNSFWIECLGWAATCVFVASYFFAKPSRLRAIQMAGALLWITNGVLIGALPVIIANTKVDRYYFNSDVVTFFTSGDVTDLAGSMRRLLESTTARREQAARASLFVESYSWKVKQDEYLKLVDHLSLEPSSDYTPIDEAAAD